MADKANKFESSTETESRRSEGKASMPKPYWNQLQALRIEAMEGRGNAYYDALYDLLRIRPKSNRCQSGSGGYPAHNFSTGCNILWSKDPVATYSVFCYGEDGNEFGLNWACVGQCGRCGRWFVKGGDHNDQTDTPEDGANGYATRAEAEQAAIKMAKSLRQATKF